MRLFHQPSCIHLPLHPSPGLPIRRTLIPPERDPAMSSDIRSAGTLCLYLLSSLAQMALYWHLAVRCSSSPFSHAHILTRPFASQAADNVAKIWSPFSGELIRNLNGHTKGLSDISWSPDSVYLATASDDHTIRIWDVDSVRTIREIDKVWHSNELVLEGSKQ